MRYFTKFLSVLLLVVSSPVLAESFEAPLSAQVNRGGMIMTDCQKKHHMDETQCQCIFTKAIDHDVSNADLMDYFANASDNMPSTTFNKLNLLRDHCIYGTKLPEAPEAKPVVEEASDNMQTCLQRDGMNKARCECLLKDFEEKKYSDSDIGWFLKGKSSKMSDFDVYSKMAKTLWNCESAVVKEETKKEYSSKTSTNNSSNGNSNGLTPIKNPQKWKSLENFIFNCHNFYKRDKPYCKCMYRKIYPYVHQWEYQALQSSFSMSSVPNHMAKYNFIKRTEKQCAVEDTKGILSKEEIDNENRKTWNMNPDGLKDRFK